MNNKIRNKIRRFYDMYPEMNFDNIALFKRDLNERKDGTKYGTELIETGRKTGTPRNRGRKN